MPVAALRSTAGMRAVVYVIVFILSFLSGRKDNKNHGVASLQIVRRTRSMWYNG